MGQSGVPGNGGSHRVPPRLRRPDDSLLSTVATFPCYLRDSVADGVAGSTRGTRRRTRCRFSKQSESKLEKRPVLDRGALSDRSPIEHGPARLLGYWMVQVIKQALLAFRDEADRTAGLPWRTQPPLPWTGPGSAGSSSDHRRHVYGTSTTPRVLHTQSLRDGAAGTQCEADDRQGNSRMMRLEWNEKDGASRGC